jgi:hypothetical protein
MKKLLILLPLLFASCDPQTNFKVIERQGHIYLWQYPVDQKSASYIHDPNCPACKAALHEKTEEK